MPLCRETEASTSTAAASAAGTVAQILGGFVPSKQVSGGINLFISNYIVSFYISPVAPHDESLHK